MMPIRFLAATAAAFALAGCATAPGRPDAEHGAHHPPPGAAPAAAPAGPAAGTPATPDAMAEQMRRMRDMHQRMQAANTPEARAALMEEHMQLMQKGMAMMGGMRDGTRAGGMAGGGMMGMHAAMEQRMAMMEQMMQMMVDRAAATAPPR